LTRETGSVAPCGLNETELPKKTVLAFHETTLGSDLSRWEKRPLGASFIRYLRGLMGKLIHEAGVSAGVQRRKKRQRRQRRQQGETNWTPERPKQRATDAKASGGLLVE
jgi:hypothetical protein